MPNDDFDRTLQGAFAQAAKEASNDLAFVEAWRRRRRRRQGWIALATAAGAVALAALIRGTAPWLGASISSLGDQALQGVRWDAMAAAAALIAMIAAVSSVIVRPR